MYGWREHQSKWEHFLRFIRHRKTSLKCKAFTISNYKERTGRTRCLSSNQDSILAKTARRSGTWVNTVEWYIGKDSRLFQRDYQPRSDEFRLISDSQNSLENCSKRRITQGDQDWQTGKPGQRRGAFWKGNSKASVCPCKSMEGNGLGL